MRIPHLQLSPTALRAVVEEFVTRDGTDYSSAGWTIIIPGIWSASAAGYAMLIFHRPVRWLWRTFLRRFRPAASSDSKMRYPSQNEI